MFTAMSSFGLFFAVGMALVILGFIFEDKLIEFEDKVFNKASERKANK